MANSKIIPTTKTFERVNDNDWVALIRKSDKTNRSVGTIRSESKPNVSVPVFPKAFFQKVNPENQDFAIYDDLYSHKDYGRWALNKYAFNIDRSNLRMIDSTGEISNMFIPTTPMDLHEERDDDQNFNRKVYFTAQGSIVADTNCVPPSGTMNKMTINECNGTYMGKPQVSANDEGMLAYNESYTSNQNGRFDGSGKGRSKWFKKGKTVVLKEKDEPWFLDVDIVGDVLHTTDPHKVTGAVNLIGTNYGDTDEIKMPTNSGCVTDDLIIGYSMAGKRDKCLGIEKFDDDSETDVSVTNYNNVIMYIICIIIVVLLLYRRH